MLDSAMPLWSVLQSRGVHGLDSGKAAQQSNHKHTTYSPWYTILFIDDCCRSGGGTTATQGGNIPTLHQLLLVQCVGLVKVV